MARFVKQAIIPGAGDYAVSLPSGPTSARPAYPVDGQLRWNTDTNKFEGYSGTEWVDFAKVGVTEIVKDSFIGDGITVSFTMSITEPTETAILVFIGNVHQNPSVAYTVSGTTITFVEAPPAGMDIVVLHGLNSTNAI